MINLNSKVCVICSNISNDIITTSTCIECDDDLDIINHYCKSCLYNNGLISEYELCYYCLYMDKICIIYNNNYIIILIKYT